MIGNALSAIGRRGSMLGNPTPGGAAATISQQIGQIAWPILAVIAGLGVLFAIWLGVRLATAQDESKRKEAKAQLIWALIAVVLVIGLMLVFQAVAGLFTTDPAGSTE